MEHARNTKENPGYPEFILSKKQLEHVNEQVYYTILGGSAMAIHEEVLRAAIRLCRDRGNWTFKADEVVLRLPHLNESSVRTHIVSRCCVNAPKNHPHKWDYFRRIHRGLYAIQRAYRNGTETRRIAVNKKAAAYGGTAARETAAPYYAGKSVLMKDTIHAVVLRDQGFYVGECLEVAVVTQGRTLDELVSNLEEAVSLHLEGEDLQRMGIHTAPRLAVIYEIPVCHHVPKA
jgi:predicted RNase H-like HicB family nuclease